MDQRQRPIADGVQQRRGNRVVVRGYVRLGDSILGIEQAVRVRQLLLRLRPRLRALRLGRGVALRRFPRHLDRLLAHGLLRLLVDAQPLEGRVS